MTYPRGPMSRMRAETWGVGTSAPASLKNQEASPGPVPVPVPPVAEPWTAEDVRRACRAEIPAMLRSPHPEVREYVLDCLADFTFDALERLFTPDELRDLFPAVP